MKAKQETYKYACDFETTVYDGQKRTDVWSSAVTRINDGTDEVKIFGSIDDTFKWLTKLNRNIILYYHNLRFDGTFWLNFLKHNSRFTDVTERGVNYKKDLFNNEYCYTISSMGQWYRILIKTRGKVIEIRDSLKLMPFSLKEVGEAFQTRHKKLEMEYKGIRYPNCPISESEKEYIKNDVLVLKEALEFMFSQGHDGLTIGSCCFKEFKDGYGRDDYNELFPDLTKIELDESYGATNADEYIRYSYHGGWCYCVEEKANKIYINGLTGDVNSLYPSSMHSESGNYYPVGTPHFFKGNIPDQALRPARYYFVRFRCRFSIKNGFLPFVQVKRNRLYPATKMLRTSDVFNYKTGEYSRYYKDYDGTTQEAVLELTMTQTDFALFKEHYNVYDLTILDGCWFYAQIGLFDEYINKYRGIKMNSKGAMRTLAKLFLNNLYGKLASSEDSSYKVAIMTENGLMYKTVEAHDKKIGFIACGSAVTSYARNFTIRAAQKNYYGPDKSGFIYADTDSIHLDLPYDQVKGITVDPVKFCCWKIESNWDVGYFARQKTYIEHIVAEDLDQIDKPYYNIKCAGMSKRCKELFIYSMQGSVPLQKYTEAEKKFLGKVRTVKDFKIGLSVPGKLRPVQIDGGTVLVDVNFTMH